MRISPRLSGPALILYLQLWGSWQVEALKFTVDSWTEVITGVPFDVTWTGASSGSTLTLSLQNGTLASPNLVNNIATSISSNAYTWTPGNRAIVGQEFFLKVADTGGSTALGDKFTVLASSSKSTSTSASRTSSSSQTSRTSTSETTTQTSPAATSSAASSGTSGGLSTGAKAGIGVGAALGGIAIIALIGFFILRRRKVRKAKNNLQELGGNDLAGRTPQEKQNHVLAQSQPPVEMQGTVPGRPEMEGSPGVRAEMAA